MKDYYKILGVPKDADDRQIKKAYKKLALKYHPDKNPGDEASVQKFKEAAEAFGVLGDRQKRTEYDQFGYVGRRSPFTHPTEDFFQSVFGRRRTRQLGKRTFAQHVVDLNFVATGGEVIVHYQKRDRCDKCGGSGGEKMECQICGGSGRRAIPTPVDYMIAETTCEACQGLGKIVTKPCDDCQKGLKSPVDATTRLYVPAGIEDGMQMQIPGLGEPGPDGNGDLIVTIHVQPHEMFSRLREGVLLIQVPVTLSQLIFGCKLDVPTLNEIVSINVPAQTQSGTKFRLKGKGLPKIQGGNTTYNAGDMIVEVKLETPSAEKYVNILDELKTLEEQHVTPAQLKYQEYLQKWKDG